MDRELQWLAEEIGLKRIAAKLRRDRDDQEDLCQVGRIAIATNWPAIWEANSQAKLAYVVASRAMISAARKLERPIDADFDRLLSSEVPDPLRLSVDSLMEVVESMALSGELTRRERDTLLLTALYDRTSESIGMELGIAASTVRVHLARARAKVRNHFEIASAA